MWDGGGCGMKEEPGRTKLYLLINSLRMCSTIRFHSLAKNGGASTSETNPKGVLGEPGRTSGFFKQV